MSPAPRSRKRLWRLESIVVLTMALIGLILGGSALYIGMLLDGANLAVEKNQSLAYSSRDKAVEVIEKQLPLESYLRQLTHAAREFQYEFELLILDPARKEEKVRNIHLEMKTQLIRVRPLLSHLPPGLVDKLTANADILIALAEELLDTRSSNARLQLYLDSQKATSHVIETVEKILLLQGIQSDGMKLELLGINSDAAEGVSQYKKIYQKLGLLLYLTLGVGLVLAFIAQLVFLRFMRKRLGMLEQYAIEIAQEEFGPPPFSSRDRIGHLAIRLGLMGRSIRKLLKQKEQAAQETNQLTFYDSLTGLENRRLFIKRLEQAFKTVQRFPDQIKAVLYLDLDDFKNINDTLGHEVGDELLKQIGKRLEKSLRQDDSLARLGGDEFAMLLHHGGDASEVLAQRIQKSLLKPLYLNGREFVCTASIGISVMGVDGLTPSEVMKHADLALNNAKEQGKNNYQFYSEALNERAHQRMYLLSEMRKAISNKEFKLFYQPKIDNKTRKINGMEALIRWPHPEKGFIFPDQFIPEAEESGLIVPIGEWVLREACQQAKALADAGHPLAIAVNISGRQFYEIDLVELIENVLSEVELAPELLEIEITESMLIDNIEKSIDILNDIRALGVSIAIDDFGTGFSSLNYLKNLPLDVLKIDRSFVNNVVEDAKDETIVKTIIDLAHRLDLKVVAEGIETEEQFHYLTALGCDTAQGYLFSRPLPIEELDIPAFSGESREKSSEQS